MAATATGDRGEEFVEAEFDKYLTRMLARGLDYDTLCGLRADIDSWDRWCERFSAVGEEFVGLAEEALDDGNEETAGSHLVQASMYFHYGSFVWNVDAAERTEAHQRSVDCFDRAGGYLDPPVERLEIPYDEGDYDVRGNLRFPRGYEKGDDVPLVLILGGLDSTKEESASYSPLFHDRGMATLAVDGPGQGETLADQRMTPEFHRGMSAVIDHLESEGIDVSQLGVYGLSLGGFYAPQLAANDDRVDGCVGVSGPFTIGPISRGWPPVLVDQFKWVCKTESMTEVDDITERMTLQGDIDDLTVPSLMITGSHDAIIPPEQTERIAERAPNGRFIEYEDGGHCCTNILAKYGPHAADWLRDTIVDT